MKRRRRRGQALIEYVLLVAFCTLIFASVFSIIRRNLFVLWVCQLYPRIASISGCTDTNDCWAQIVASGGDRSQYCPP